MNNNKHTPGPWSFCGTGTLLHPISHSPLVTTRIETTLGCLEILDETNEPDENARLIAAAPELLNACESLFKTLDALDYFRDCPEAMMLKRVIAKAKGETL